MSNKNFLAILIHLYLNHISHIDSLFIFLRSLEGAYHIHFLGCLMTKYLFFDGWNYLIFVVWLKNESSFYPVYNKNIWIIFPIHQWFNKRIIIEIKVTNKFRFLMNDKKSIKKGTGYFNWLISVNKKQVILKNKFFYVRLLCNLNLREHRLVFMQLSVYCIFVHHLIVYNVYF